MDANAAGLPVKTREMHNHHMNSTVWNDFVFRDDDVIIASYAKSGTTWLQQIVGQLIYDGAEDVSVPDVSPWLDLRVPPREVKFEALEAQAHRRFIKTHLPVDALVFSPRAKYLYIARDGRDVVWSFHNHHVNANDRWYERINDTPGRVGPPIDRPITDIHQYYRDWFEQDGFPIWPYWENVRSWWAIRDLPNVMLMHYAALKADMPAEIRRIAAFLDIPADGPNWDAIVAHCGFDYMKANAAAMAPAGGIVFVGGAGTFINKGMNGRWRETLTAEECDAYEARAVAELGPECAEWLRSG